MQWCIASVLACLAIAPAFGQTAAWRAQTDMLGRSPPANALIAADRAAAGSVALPTLDAGKTRLAPVWIPGFTQSLSADTRLTLRLRGRGAALVLRSEF